MKTRTLFAFTATITIAACVAAEEIARTEAKPGEQKPSELRSTIPEVPATDDSKAGQNRRKAKAKAKPLDESIKKGLAWLAESQQADGGWGQGGGWRVDTNSQSRGSRVDGANVADPSDVGNTAIALKAFLRAGTKLDDGDYAKNARKAAKFIFKSVEGADDDSLFVTKVRGTQIQSKIGPYVDTFLSMQVLSDLKGKMQNEKAEKRRDKCLAKLTAKVEKHQNEDGSFQGNVAWAATVSQGIASRALNAAFAAGAPVAEEVLERDHVQNATGLDRGSGQVAAGAGGVSDAGVAIYRYASKLGGMVDFAKNNNERRRQLEQTVASDDASDEMKQEARQNLAQIKRADDDKDVLLENVSRQAQQDGFVAGFGSNGGEEFVSYMNIAEALHAKGGKPWNEWQTRMDGIIKNAQHNDGSWSGQHCITGRTFCTSTALLTLTTEKVQTDKEEPVAVNE